MRLRTPATMTAAMPILFRSSKDSSVFPISAAKSCWARSVLVRWHAMGQMTIDDMRSYLRRSITSGPQGENLNKIRGLLAEIRLRDHLHALGFGDRVSMGGWIARPKRVANFGEQAVALFPQIIAPDTEYDPSAALVRPTIGVHSIAARFSESGIHPFWCAARIPEDGVVEWHAMQLGLPEEQSSQPLVEAVEGFARRERRHNFLTGKTNVSSISTAAIPEEFSKEHLRVSFQSLFLCEIVDIEGVFFGRQHTYPIEIKEKREQKTEILARTSDSTSARSSSLPSTLQNAAISAHCSWCVKSITLKIVNWSRGDTSPLTILRR